MTTKREMVTFYSPGTFVDETTALEIAKWEPSLAIRLSGNIEERHGAKPYAFQFSTVVGGNDVVVDGEKCKVESKTIKSSGLHYIDGKVLTFKDIPDDDEHHILRSNMECNGWSAVVETRNSYRHTGIFDKNDVVVNSTSGEITARGSDYAPPA